MFAYLPAHLKEYSIMQVSIANGSPISWTVKPEDFSYRQQDGTMWQAATALSVVDSLLAKAGRHDVIKLVTTYERGVYGNEHMQTTNGYESRRQSALAEGVSSRLKAGAAASALALVPTKLAIRRIHRWRYLFPQQRQSPRPRNAGGSYRRRNVRIPLRRRTGDEVMRHGKARYISPSCLQPLIGFVLKRLSVALETSTKSASLVLFLHRAEVVKKGQ